MIRSSIYDQGGWKQTATGPVYETPYSRLESNTLNALSDPTFNSKDFSGQKGDQVGDLSLASILKLIQSPIEGGLSKWVGGDKIGRKDTAARNTGGNIGGSIGSLVGSYFGPVGSTVGSMLGGWIGKAIAKPKGNILQSLFG